MSSTTDGPFRLTFEVDRTSLPVGQPLTGTATLSLLSGGPVTVGRSGGGFFGFRYAEVGGTRDIEPAMTADCASDVLVAGQPRISSLTKSGGYDPKMPDASFYASFFADPQVKLTAGTWEVTAVAIFIEGGDCTGAQHDIEAPLMVHVGA